MALVQRTNQQVTQVFQRSVRILNFLQSGDGPIIKMVQETHKPDGRQVDVQYLSTIVAKILLSDTPNGGDDFSSGRSIAREVPAEIINKLSCEISCNCSGRNAQETTLMLLEKFLSNYSWDAKMVIMVAAFAVNYGEFYLLADLYSENPIAKNISVLKQLQGIMEDANLSKHLSEAITDLIKAIMALVQSVFKFNSLPAEYIASNKPPLSTAVTDIIRAVYWTIYSVVTCASYIVALIGLKNQHAIAATMTLELSELAQKVSSLQTILQEHFSRCKQEIGAYNLISSLFDTAQDNTKIFQALFLVEGGKQPLVVGSTKQEIKIDVLKDTKVLLLISSLDAWAEIKALAKLYQELQTKGKIEYQILWIPVVENLNEQKFSSLQALMPWYTVRHPSIIKTEVIRYIKEVWKFTKDTILVPFDQHGRAQPAHTLELLWIEGHLPGLIPSPPGVIKVTSPWEEHQLTLDMLIHDIYTVDKTKPAPIICLYGGEDMKWIEDFTTAITKAKESTKLNIELVYVSKSNAIDEANQSIFDFITTKKIGGYWKAEEAYSWRFWTRLESIFYSGIKQGKNAKEDNIMKDVMTLLSFNGSYKGWVVFGQLGSSQKIMAKAMGEIVPRILLKINTWWKAGSSNESFLIALNHQIEQQLQAQAHHCNHIIFPPRIAEVPDEMMICAICDRKMTRNLMFRCCM